ncbi:hypothetical protein [Chryseobacterium sp.]|uniref:hypothetical protein n=1 Tax=Chryseobacterium sp. TaxID=1871047 RepID=UPI00289E75FC|nr:hypothetical protein [Chryseobacterium sp.]
MNWIIRSTKKVKFHTNLQEVLHPVWKELSLYHWVMTDLDFICDDPIPINFDHDFFVLDHEQFECIYNSNTQFIWGIIAAVPHTAGNSSSSISQLSAEDPEVWKSNHFLIAESILEIIAVDSGYTIVKFKDKSLSEKFKNYFQEEAVDLHTFNEKYLKKI